jgi:FkbM family methyltransferase
MTGIQHPFGTYAGKTHWKVRYRPLLAQKAIPGVIRKYLKTYPYSLISDVEVEGIKFRCYPAQNGHDKMFFYGNIFEQEREEFAFMLAKAANAECVIDIGANTGSICIPIALKAPGVKRVLAIEPEPVNLERLHYNVALNNASNITVVPCAVAATHGVMRLWKTKRRNAGQHSLHNIGRGKKEFADVGTKPLYDIVTAHGVSCIDLLKIDIEGYEDRALMPFFRKAERSLWPKAVSIEHVGRAWWAEDCLTFMLVNGYAVDRKTEYNTLLSLRKR